MMAETSQKAMVEEDTTVKVHHREAALWVYN